jgi:hypothetical protein
MDLLPLHWSWITIEWIMRTVAQMAEWGRIEQRENQLHILRSVSGSGHRNMPSAIENAVSRNVAGLRVFDEGVERLALVGPLRGFVVASHKAPIARCLSTCGSHQRRPVRGALTATGGFPAAVLVEGIERHALGIDEGLAFAGVGDLAGAVAWAKTPLAADKVMAMNAAWIRGFSIFYLLRSGSDHFPKGQTSRVNSFDYGPKASRKWIGGDSFAVDHYCATISGAFVQIAMGTGVCTREGRRWDHRRIRFKPLI